jgi:hypothetical protein
MVVYRASFQQAALFGDESTEVQQPAVAWVAAGVGHSAPRFRPEASVATAQRRRRPTAFGDEQGCLGGRAPLPSGRHRQPAVPARHQGNAQPPGRTARARREDIPRTAPRTVPAIPGRNGRPAWRAGYRFELRRCLEHRLYRRRPQPAARLGLLRARRRCRTPQPVHAKTCQRPREILFHCRRTRRPGKGATATRQLRDPDARDDEDEFDEDDSW